MNRERKGLQRLRSLPFWIGVVAIIITVSGINPENMTEWGILLENISDIFRNPFVLISIVAAVFSFYNNTTDPDHV